MNQSEHTGVEPSDAGGGAALGLAVERPHQDIVVVRLNRPAMLNPVSVEIREAINTELAALEREAGTARVVIFTGTGRAFSAGGDVSQMPDFLGDGPDRAATEMLRFQEIARLMWRLPVPVITAVNGDARGGGTALAMMGDLRVASNTARFAVGQVHRVVVPDVGLTYILPRVIGLARAMELMLLGRSIDAQQALDWGIVNELVPSEEVLDRAMALAAEIAALPEPSVRWIKRVTHLNLDSSFDQALAMEALAIGATTGTREFADGLEEFQQGSKRTTSGREGL
jgi:2-(1,2-epoxy-1,2-dihydrophenyl)acetyl-CoA isomerase